MSAWRADNPNQEPDPESVGWEEVDGKWVQGVNICTGRRGYFKRVCATDKSVNRVSELHSGEMEVSEEAVDKYEAYAVKQTTSKYKAIDVSELPIFQFMAPSGFSQKALPPLFSASSSSGAASHSQALVPLPAPTPAPLSGGDAEVDDDIKPSEVMHEPVRRDMSSGLLFAMPAATAKAKCLAATKAGAKASAKAHPKSHAKAKAKAQTNKRKKDTEPEIITMESVEEPAAKTRKTTDGDNAILTEFNGKLNRLKEEGFAMIQDNDQAVTEALKKGNKELMHLNQSIKTKIKSLGRRKDNPVMLKDGLDSLVDIISEFQIVCAGLIHLNIDDTEAPRFLQQKVCDGWKISEPLMKRAFKTAFMSHLKYSDWEAMCSSTRPALIEEFGDARGNDLFEMFLNEVVQRLLRSIPANKVTLDDSASNTQPLRQLLDHLLPQSFIDSRPISLTLKKIDIILNPTQHLPAEVKAATDMMQETAQSQVHADSGLAAVFCSISQGKQLRAQAIEFAESTSQKVEFVESISDSLKDLEALSSELNSTETKMTDCIDKLLDVTRLIKTSRSKAENDVVLNFLEKSGEQVIPIVKVIFKVFVSKVALPWFSTSLDLHSASPGKFCPMPALQMKQLAEMVASKLIPGSSSLSGSASKQISVLCELQKQMVAVDNIVAKHASGTLNTTEIFNCSNAFNAFVKTSSWELIFGNTSLLTTFENTTKMLMDLKGAKVKSEHDNLLQALGRLMCKVNNGADIQEADISSAETICAKLTGISSDSANPKAIATLSLSKWILLACKSHAAASAMDTTERSMLRGLLKPFFVLQQQHSSQTTSTEIDKTIEFICEILFDQLQSSKEFTESFEAKDAFLAACVKPFVDATRVLEARKGQYDKDAKPLANDLVGLLKGIPQPQMDSLKSFVNTAKKSEKILLQKTDNANSLLQSVALDVKEFACTPSDICPMQQELTSAQHAALTHLAELSAAVLLTTPQIMKWIESGGKAQGRFHELVSQIMAYSREKSLEINAGIQATLTSLI
ncbi:unnamed protein product [Durusdinium trenchii]